MTLEIGSRTSFPALQWEIYANHASVSPLALPVQIAATQVLAGVAERGLEALVEGLVVRAELREEMARFLGVQPDDLGFPPGTTRGISDIALALDWQAGDRIVVFDGEFPSNVLPWMAAAERFGASVEVLPLSGFGDGSGLGLERVQEALRAGGVRLVAVSAVQFSTGLRMPVAALGRLAHEHGAELFVDGIQAVGGLPVDLTEVDYLVAGAHKWLMGLDGLAVAYAAPAARERLRPLTAGWLSVEEPLSFLTEGAGHLRYDREVRRTLDWMEGGVQTQAAFAAMLAGLRMLAELTPSAIAAHVQQLHDVLEAPLLERGFTSARASDPAARSNILSLRPEQPEALPVLAAALREQRISVSTPDGWLRISPHWPNDVDQMRVLADAIARAS
ncbi:MAG: aminotransferase class V-fold PLP-dependent enzyme [Myxococcales bacterium]|nr:aminotransferase class V-fold PLP-dependent enzyme [Myxococcales bacterium]